MTIFEFVPAAQEAESRGSHCFFNMSSSSRWNRASAASSSDQAQSNTRGQEHQSYDFSRRHSADGYALRRSEEIPADKFRTPSTLPNEDHLSFCYDLQAPNRLVSGSRESEEEERAQFTYIDGSTQHETN